MWKIDCRYGRKARIVAERSEDRRVLQGSKGEIGVTWTHKWK